MCCACCMEARSPLVDECPGWRLWTFFPITLAKLDDSLPALTPAWAFRLVRAGCNAGLDDRPARFPTALRKQRRGPCEGRDDYNGEQDTSPVLHYLAPYATGDGHTLRGGRRELIGLGMECSSCSLRCVAPRKERVNHASSSTGERACAYRAGSRWLPLFTSDRSMCNWSQRRGGVPEPSSSRKPTRPHRVGARSYRGSHRRRRQMGRRPA